MISQDQFAALTTSHTAIGKMSPKVQEIIRDELEPDTEISYSQSAKIGGTEGVVFTTGKDLFAFWTMKMLIFIKLPAQQQFNLAQIRKIEPNGSSVYVRAEANPDQPDDDYEENTFSFGSAQQAQEFCEALNMVSTC